MFRVVQKLLYVLKQTSITGGTTSNPGQNLILKIGMRTPEGSQAQRYVERTFTYRISGTGARLKKNLPVHWQTNDDFTGRTLCICAMFFIYYKMSLSNFHIPAFFQNIHLLKLLI